MVVGKATGLAVVTAGDTAAIVGGKDGAAVGEATGLAVVTAGDTGAIVGGKDGAAVGEATGLVVATVWRKFRNNEKLLKKIELI